MNVFCYVVFTILAVCACAVKSDDWSPLNPEEALFVYTRCMEDHFGGNYQKLSGWRQWNLSTEDLRYAKCVLFGLGIIDSSCNVQKGRISAQFNAYKDYIDVNEISVEKWEKAIPPSGDCKNFLMIYIDVHSKHKDTSRSVFHGKEEITSAIYADKKNSIRQKGQSYFDFCEKKHYGRDKTLCKVRQYEVLTDNKFSQLTKCIFQGLRYTDRNGKINSAEINRDFALVGVDASKLLQKCDAKQDAVSFYTCMVTDKKILASFREAFDYREIRSRDYAYRLDPKNQKYNEKQIKAEIKAIDDGLCKT